MSAIDANKKGEFHALLEYVKEVRAVDFTAYRPDTIKRRLDRRINSVGAPDYNSYLYCLKENPREMEGLIDALTIKVSHFFRNPFVFEALKKFVLPELIESRHGEGLRVWSAGCARGEEAYSMAILLNEIMREELLFKYLFILATDIDINALNDGQNALYTNEALSEVKKGYFDRYFAAEGDSHRLKDEMRAMVTFASHDITTCKPPTEGIFSRYHIILCRNILMYLGRDMQERVFQSLSESLLNNGYLILGEAEIIPQQLSGDFHEVIPHTKVFRKGP